MSPALDGGCLCGRVRYRISRAPVSAGICHCRSCRLPAGAESVAWATVPRDGVALTGPVTVYASSPGIRRGFCPTCGSALTYDDGGATIDVVLATLDDPEAIRPEREIWLEHRISWNALDPDLPGFPRGAAD